MKIAGWIVALAMALGLANAARADEAVGPEAFYGHYTGKGTAHDPQMTGLGLNYRDLDVEIGAADGGFFVAWTTVMEALGQETKRTQTRITFEPSSRTGIYVGRVGNGNVENGFSWATIAGKALTVRQLTILDDGSYEIHSYRRTLSKDGLFLVYRSDRDGIAVNMVSANLEKQAQ